MTMHRVIVYDSEILLLAKWMSKIVDRYDLVQELEEDGEYNEMFTLYKVFDRAASIVNKIEERRHARDNV